ncbi:AraC family transcriptional regulator [Corallococcus exiguus]|uniref:AraC family transcriptional regulator n=1 Tax=Corallococcus TaxID=83461 RepID=UPI000EC9667F|nr:MULTISPECIES: AraC family transcriptional regulator [Corallococcus]NNB92881.1 AraC family transcriptional regulator [Corallococcus exiguus]NPC45863.1 AraC family transcriptional regulator [Corallococcus exiguus]RKH83311.1 AraC family transcriptional regulator [Corallococcus sp. AB032C]
MASAGANENQVKFWPEPALESVEYLCAEYRDFAFPAHFHETYAIGIIERGAQRFRPGRSSPLLMPEGTLCVINPGMVHEGNCGVDGGWRYRMFYPSPTLVLRALETHRSPPSFDGHVLLDSSLYRQFEALHRASQCAEDLLERESRTLMFLRELFTRHTAAPAGSRLLRDPRTVSRVRQSLHDRFSENISIAELAAESGVSETQVIRSFSAATGLAPHAYLIALRVERARHFIRLGMPLVEVTALAGFSDQSHLTRHFKRITSITPGAFARMAGRR